MFKIKTILEYALLTAWLSTSENLYVLSVWNEISSIDKSNAEEYDFSIREASLSMHRNQIFVHKENKELSCLIQQHL